MPYVIMIKEIIKTVICGFVWAAAAYYPANSFYGLGYWQLLGVYATTAVFYILVCIAAGATAGFSDTVAEGWNNLGNLAFGDILKLAITYSVSIMLFIASLSAMAPTSNVIENIVITGIGMIAASIATIACNYAGIRHTEA